MIRRDYLKMLALGAGASVLPSFTQAEKLTIQSRWEGKNILFQGDSITDAGRDKDNLNPNAARALGTGYSFHAASNLLRTNPQSDFQIFNRGISGHKVFQLRDRWDVDCINLKPDLLSILIGVNDFWHKLSNGYQGTIEIYENDFRALLNRTFEALPNVKIIICEPFIVEGGTAITDEWTPDFFEYQVVSKKLAKEFNTGYVPFQAYFNKALEEAPASYWCPDGVHPSIPGAVLMSEAWIETFKRM